MLVRWAVARRLVPGPRLVPTAAGVCQGRGFAVAARRGAKKRSKGALDVAISQIESMYGSGSLMRLGDTSFADAKRWTAEDVIPTGSFRLDHALGVGGLPRGRVTEIYGPESSGKTTLALHAIAEVQKQGGVATFIDVEHALDTEYAAALGVDMDELYISQPQSGEQALEIMDTLVRSASMDLVVLDSVAALVPRAELEGEMGDVHVGLQARLMSQALRKLTASLSAGPLNQPGGGRMDDGSDADVKREHPSALIFINQLRQKIGVMYGNDEVTSGGNSLKYYASVRMEVRRQIPKGAMTMGHTGSSEGSGVAPTANMVTVKVVKNKVAPPFRQAQFAINFGTGICQLSEVLELCIETGFLTQAGSWFTLRLPWEPVISSDTADAAETPQSGEEEEEESPDHWEEVLKVQGLHSVRSEMAARPELMARMKHVALQQLNSSQPDLD